MATFSPEMFAVIRGEWNREREDYEQFEIKLLVKKITFQMILIKALYNW